MMTPITKEELDEHSLLTPQRAVVRVLNVLTNVSESLEYTYARQAQSPEPAEATAYAELVEALNVARRKVKQLLAVQP